MELSALDKIGLRQWALEFVVENFSAPLNGKPRAKWLLEEAEKIVEEYLTAD